jgi:hypothetical protein
VSQQVHKSFSSMLLLLLLQIRRYAPDDLKFVIEDITDGDASKVGVKW